MTWGPLTEAALARPNTAPTSSFVYFVFDEQRRRIKIGVARDLTKRVSSLQTASATPLALAGALAGARSLERELHETFAGLRDRGEWFRIDSRLVALLEEVQAAARRDDVTPPRFTDELLEETVVTIAASHARELAQLLGITENEGRRWIRAMPDYRGARVRFVEDAA